MGGGLAAVVAARPPSGCTPAWSACGLRSVRCRPPTSPCPPPAAFGLIARYASRSRSTSTWCNSAVNRASLSRTATCRTRSSALVASRPVLCPGRALLAVFPLVDPLPPLAPRSPPRPCSSASQVLRDRPTSHNVHPRITSSALHGRPARRSTARGARDLPDFAHEGSVHALVL